MQQVHPHERFSHNEQRTTVPPELIRQVTGRLFGKDLPVIPFEGGFNNANYLATNGKRKSVVRIYSVDSTVAQREIGILNFLENRGVPVPKVYNYFEIENRPVAELEFVEGRTLQNLLLNGEFCSYSNIGETLANIHSIELSRAGFIGQDMRIGREFSEFAPFLREYMLKVLADVPQEKLNPSIRDRLLKLIEEKWHLVLATEPEKHLVHCDFNPKNILMNGAGVIAAVLDWEFSISGSGYIDLGNFFRFFYDYPSTACGDFARGYKTIRPDLVDNWQDVALLADLGNMCSFLERKEDYPETFRTARIVIDRTLKHFNF